MTACVLASLGLPITSEAYTFCVVPSQKAVTGETYRAHRLPCLENKTWNEYLADQRRYFSDISNVTFLFYPGTHLMNGSLEANQTENLLIIGSSPDSVLLTSTFPGRSTPLRFNNFSNVRVEGMAIKLCAAVWPYSDYDNGVVYFSTGKNASVLNSRLNNECNGSEVYSEWVENILVSDISIHKSKESLHGSVCLYHGVFGNISVFNSTFDLTSSNYDSNGVFVFLSFSSMPENSLPIENSSVTVDHCSFTCRNVLTINLAKGCCP